METLFEKRGVPSLVAKELGISRVNLTRWKRKGYVPAGRCASVEKISGVPAEVLNPFVKWVRVRCAGWPSGKPVADLSANKEPKT